MGKILLIFIPLLLAGCADHFESPVNWSAIGYDGVPFDRSSLECELEASKAPGTAHGLIGAVKYLRVHKACMRSKGFIEAPEAFKEIPP
jgi:hypothetical protein